SVWSYLVLIAHTPDRARARRWIQSRLNSHPRGSLPKLVRVLPRCCHAPHPPVESEPPPDPGRFMFISFFDHDAVAVDRFHTTSAPMSAFPIEPWSATREETSRRTSS